MMVGLYAPDNSSSFLSRSKIPIDLISDYAVQPSIAHNIPLGTCLHMSPPGRSSSARPSAILRFSLCQTVPSHLLR